MIVQNWWYTTLLGIRDPLQPPLTDHLRTEVLVVGAGMSGLTAAWRLALAGRKVVLLDRNICG
ncbi:MAG TPA: FAD-dependent oxidoreductase, partial [Gemmatimonadales bacterium]|nr:FAD-dependent oxidoreductase [Gemmatimonadales bacterium]